MSYIVEHLPAYSECENSHGKRILIVGHSHCISPEDFANGERDGPNFTKCVINQIRSGTRMAFFTSTARAFGEANPSEFFRSVSFMNFIPSVVEHPSAFGSDAQIARGRERLEAELDKMRPDATIIFSTKVWEACWSDDRDWHVLNGEKHWVTQVLVGEHQVTITRHPRGASQEHLAAAVRIALGNA